MPISHRHRPNQYASYISPLPAEDVIRMGQVKQDLYSQGVSTAQSYMNNLAQYGLDMVKTTDREYFTNQLSNLTDIINQSVKGVDFSNINNVRSLLNVGKPLQNDPNVLNAIQSTQEFRRRHEVLNSMNPKLRNAVNDWDFMRDADSWLNDGQVGTKLGQRAYTPYRDVSSKVSNLAKQLKPTITSDIIKQMGGQYIDQQQLAQLTRERMADAIGTLLDEGDKNQIRLDAEYAIKDIPNEQLSQYYFQKFGPRLSELENSLQNYLLNPPKTSEDFDNLRFLASAADVLKENMSQVAQGDPSVAYESILRDSYLDFVTGQSKMYSYRQAKDQLHTNQFMLENIRYANQRALQTERAIMSQYVINPDGSIKRNEKGEPILKTEQKLSDKLSYDTTKSGKTLTATQQKQLTNVDSFYEAATNNLTSSPNWEDLNLQSLNEDQLAKLQQVLTKSLVTYENRKFGDNADTIDTVDLSNVQVKRNSDGTFAFRVNQGYGDVKEVYQDVFDENVRNELKISDDLTSKYFVENLSAEMVEEPQGRGRLDFYLPDQQDTTGLTAQDLFEVE